VEQFLVKLSLPHGQAPDYRGPLPLATGGLTLTTEKGEKYTSKFHQVLAWQNIDFLYELHVSVALSVIFLQVTFPYVLQNLLLIDIKLSDTCVLDTEKLMHNLDFFLPSKEFFDLSCLYFNALFSSIRSALCWRATTL